MMLFLEPHGLIPEDGVRLFYFQVTFPPRTGNSPCYRTRGNNAHMQATWLVNDHLKSCWRYQSCR